MAGASTAGGRARAPASMGTVATRETRVEKEVSSYGPVGIRVRVRVRVRVRARAWLRLHLPYISPISPPYLACTFGSKSAARSGVSRARLSITRGEAALGPRSSAAPLARLLRAAPG